MELSARAQSPDERSGFYEVLQTLLLDGRLTMGQTLRLLRAVHLGVTRRQYAKMIGLSNSALSDLENDTGNPTLSSIEQAFKPFGLRFGLIPVRGSAVNVHPPDMDSERLETLSAVVLDSGGGPCAEAVADSARRVTVRHPTFDQENKQRGLQPSFYLSTARNPSE